MKIWPLNVTAAKSAQLLIGLIVAIVVSSCGGGGGGGGENSNGSSDAQDSGDSTSNTLLQSCADDSSCAANPPTFIGIDRPAAVQIPSNYSTETRYPLIIALHGYGGSGALLGNYIGLNDRVDSKQYILISPDGTANANGTKFWNATPACCAAVAERDDNTGENYRQIDDVAYIRSLIEEAAATYSIDTRRIGLFGHSNGGFMALRMACEASDYITSLVSLAGSTFASSASCAPADNPVSVLAIHGDLDQTIPYDGSSLPGFLFPSALETTDRFAVQAGCDNTNPVMLNPIDMVSSVSGSETTVLSYPNCAEATKVELWTIVGGPHSPFPWLTSGQNAYVDWLINNPRR
jgi:polyhydroxybutyrate depolymerase